MKKTSFALSFLLILFAVGCSSELDRCIEANIYPFIADESAKEVYAKEKRTVEEINQDAERRSEKLCNSQGIY